LCWRRSESAGFCGAGGRARRCDLGTSVGSPPPGSAGVPPAHPPRNHRPPQRPGLRPILLGCRRGRQRSQGWTAGLSHRRGAVRSAPARAPRASTAGSRPAAGGRRLVLRPCACGTTRLLRVVSPRPPRREESPGRAPRAGRGSLLVAERLQGVHARRPPGRHEGGDARHRGQHGRDQQEGQRI